ncbi:gametocyte-specific factor 1 isoform X4 [Phaenicophaeus curvirostris]|uniref:gametocyte-specific factor 1 isoform X4 n=1 Tax=Phaenicophaeus curvirostris TaxID=33595 RepID=UPI0037F0F73E
MDPQALVQCPYDKNHRVRVSRLPYHLVKCQQNNPDVARTLVTCPFNARHRVPRQQLHSHMAFCPDQLQPSLSPELGTSLSQRGQEPKGPVAQPAPPWEEDWEAARCRQRPQTRGEARAPRGALWPRRERERQQQQHHRVPDFTPGAG